MDSAAIDPAATRTLRGGCLCGALEYEVADAFSYAFNCHCSQCRRATGAAFKPTAGIARGKLRLTRGLKRRAIHGEAGEEGAHDVHCAACGSLLYSVVREGAWAHVAMGTLIDAPAIRPTRHIFVASKAPWFEITDKLPQYAEHAA
jgi:hypothetical protein